MLFSLTRWTVPDVPPPKNRINVKSSRIIGSGAREVISVVVR